MAAHSQGIKEQLEDGIRGFQIDTYYGVLQSDNTVYTLGKDDPGPELEEEFGEDLAAAAGDIVDAVIPPADDDEPLPDDAPDDEPEEPPVREHAHEVAVREAEEAERIARNGLTDEPDALAGRIDAPVPNDEDSPLAISWEELLLEGSSMDISPRRSIVAHPVLDYGDILLGRRPFEYGEKKEKPPAPYGPLGDGSGAEAGSPPGGGGWNGR